LHSLRHLDSVRDCIGIRGLTLWLLREQ